MPLLDHFRPPLSERRHRDSFYTTWATALADRLNETLPAGFFAEEQVHPSARVEIDVATFEEPDGAPPTAPGWQPPEPDAVTDLEYPAEYGVEVYRGEGGPVLVAAVEIVSPANKDRPESRRAFAAKCDALVRRGVSVAVVDVVTARRADVRSDLAAVLGSSRETFGGDEPLFALAMRPLPADGTLAVWNGRVAVGEDLPTLPLWVAADLALPLELESAYRNACRRRRINADLRAVP